MSQNFKEILVMLNFEDGLPRWWLNNSQRFLKTGIKSGSENCWFITIVLFYYKNHC